MGATIWFILVTAAFVAAWIAVPVVNKKLKKLQDANEGDDPYSRSVPVWPKWTAIGLAVVSSIVFVFTAIMSLSYSLDPGEAGVIKSWTGEV